MIAIAAGIGFLCGLPFGLIVGAIAVVCVKRQFETVEDELDYSDGY